MANEAKFLTVKEAAEILNLHPVTVRRLLARRRLAFVRVGRAVRIPLSAIHDLEAMAQGNPGVKVPTE